MEPLDKYLRPEVQAFARAMEAKLRENDHKGGWQKDPPEALLLRAYEELGELHREVVGEWRSADRVNAADRLLRAGVRIAREAADVGNFAMMVADIVSRRGGKAGGA